MSLDISRRTKEGVAILDLAGRITTGEEATAFRDMMKELAREPEPKVVLNMAGVDYIDSTGLGAIVLTATTIKNSGGAVRLLNPDKRTMELLVMTKLSTVFDSFNDEQDAVNSFFPGRQVNRFDILAFVRSQTGGS